MVEKKINSHDQDCNAKGLSYVLPNKLSPLWKKVLADHEDALDFMKPLICREVLDKIEAVLE